MEIQDWKTTAALGPLYREIRELGLETHVAELDAFHGWTEEGPNFPNAVPGYLASRSRFA